MKIAALIPARYGSTRFPGKLLAELEGKPVISWTYCNAKSMDLFDRVYVVTDSHEIAGEIKKYGDDVIFSKKQHVSGSDRIAEAAADLDFEIIVNVQGDEPFIDKETMIKLLDAFTDSQVQTASLMRRMVDQESIANPNNVKVVVDKEGFALYFSRSPIPYNRDGLAVRICYEHIGVYAYRKAELLRFAAMPASMCERFEMIEPLRLLENGLKIKLVETESVGVEIDTPEDLLRAKEFIRKFGITFPAI